MAATNYTPISLYYSTTTTAVPTAGNLINGELAINITDGTLFYKDNAGAVQTLATKAATSGTYTSITLSGGTAGGVAYLSNPGKVLTTGSALVFDGTNLSTTGSGTLKNLLLSGGTLPAAGNPSISLRSSDNTIYHQSGSANTVVFLDSAQNTMYNMAATSHTWNISNATKMTLDSAGNLGLGVTPSAKLQVAGVQTITGGSAASSANGLHLWFNTGTNTAYIQGFQSGVDWRNIVYNANSHIWQNTDVDHMRLDASGKLLLGTTSTAGYQTTYCWVYDTPNSAAYASKASGSASGSVYWGFGYNGSGIGSITQNGTTGVLFNIMSDYRLKNDQQPLTGAKDFIMALQPKKWQWWDGSGKGVGFIAHEFMEVAKYSGSGEKDAVDENGNPVYQSIQPSSSEVMANLVAHIQELESRLAALEAK